MYKRQIYEEERGSTRRTRKYDASVSSSISLDPGTSSSTSLDPGTIQNFDAYSVVDFHEGDITGIK